MNILFLSFGKIDSIEDRTIYCDLLREFYKNGNSIYVLSPGDNKQYKKNGCGAEVIVSHIDIDTVRGENRLTKKGLITLNTGILFKKGIKLFYGNIKFDLVLYTTPPITFASAVDYIKKRDDAYTYLLLKDIFPQNAVDIGMMRKNGMKGVLYRYFRKKEKKLYALSDCIGCMSQANVDYVISHNPEVNPNNVEVCPNSIEIVDKSVDEKTRKQIRTKYGIPLNKTVFVYGGNLGKPQGIPFIIECLEYCKSIEKAFFLIVGDGSEYHLLKEYVDGVKPRHVKLMQRLPKEDYDTMVGACDVGMIFLDHRFTIPNFPSRLLSYMQAKLPVLACTDLSTDIGNIITEGKFGWQCESNNVTEFANVVKIAISTNTDLLKDNAYSYLNTYYSVKENYKIIKSRINI